MSWFARRRQARQAAARPAYARASEIAETAIGRYLELLVSGMDRDAVVDFSDEDADPAIARSAVASFDDALNAGVPLETARVGAVAEAIATAALEEFQRVRGTLGDAAAIEAVSGSSSVARNAVTSFVSATSEDVPPALAAVTARTTAAITAFEEWDAHREDGSAPYSFDDEHVGEPDVDDGVNWDVRSRTDIPERAPEAGSWIDRNLGHVADTSEVAAPGQPQHVLADEIAYAAIGRYLELRADGVSADDAAHAPDVVAHSPIARQAVSRFDWAVESGMPVEAARVNIVAGIVAQTAMNEYQALRDGGLDAEEAAQAAAGDSPIARDAVETLLARLDIGWPLAEAEEAAANNAVYNAMALPDREPVVEPLRLSDFTDADLGADAWDPNATEVVTEAAEASHAEWWAAVHDRYEQLVDTRIDEAAAADDAWEQITAERGPEPPRRPFGVHTDDDLVGEADVDDADWASTPPPFPEVPERAPEAGSWIARNLPDAPSLAVPEDYEPDVLSAEDDESEQLAYDRGDDDAGLYIGGADAMTVRASRSEAAFEVGDIVRNRHTGEEMRINFRPQDFEPFYYERVSHGSNDEPLRERDAGDRLQDMIEAADDEESDSDDDADSDPAGPTTSVPDADTTEALLGRIDELLSSPEAEAASGIDVEQFVPAAVGESSGAQASAGALAAARRLRSAEATFWADVDGREQALVAEGAGKVDAENRAWSDARDNWQAEPWSAVLPRRNDTAAKVPQPVERCARAVDDAVVAVSRVEVVDDEDEHSERLARWSAEDAKAIDAVDSEREWGQ
ncbi:hypothetical protein [Amycolatopsis sp. NPDC059657]|uniref:hypothetical protein n=1 Tax=Amycolatopsis sp. NPDC059657 TaxID=3346899 RepID=UPI00366A9968